MKQTITLELAGTKFRMATDADPAHLEHLARIVNDRIAEFGPKALRTTSPAQLLAVVALGLAEDLERAEARRRELDRTTRRAVTAALEKIDRALASSGSGSDAE